MRKKLENIGLTSESLDSIVDQAASDMATNANNGGMKSQLSFLSMNGWSDETVWKAVLLDNLNEGAEVEVDDPKPDSAHSCAFTGTVVDIQDDYVVVRDMDDNHFDVDFDEICNFK